MLRQETNNIIRDFSRNGYNPNYIKKVIASNRTLNNENREEVKGNIVIPYVRGVSEKIRRIAATYGLRTAFHSRNTIGKFICNTTPEVSKLDTKNVIYNLPCECGALYFGETCRPLGVRVGEHKNNVKQGRTNSSTLAEHVWTEQHKILWEDVKIVARETRAVKRKIKEASFMAISDNCISQASKEIPSIWLRNIKRYCGSNGGAGSTSGRDGTVG